MPSAQWYRLQRTRFLLDQPLNRICPDFNALTGSCEAFTHANGDYASFGDRGGQGGYKGFGRCKCNSDHEGEACEHSNLITHSAPRTEVVLALQRSAQFLTRKFVGERSVECVSRRVEGAYAGQGIGISTAQKAVAARH